MQAINRLLAGEFPPRDAFWNWLVARGLVLNVACTAAAMALVATAAENATWPLWLAAFLHLAAVPFNVVCTIGVWRATTTDAPTDTRYRAASLVLFVAYLIL